MQAKPCFCTHDCARCFIYLADKTGSHELRRRAHEFYLSRFGLDIPEERLHCDGGRCGSPERIFYLCRECPFMRCCREKGLDSCELCSEQCQSFIDYREQFANKCGQVDH